MIIFSDKPKLLFSHTVSALVVVRISLQDRREMSHENGVHTSRELGLYTILVAHYRGPLNLS